ncbi:Hypothetical predicted protein [Mytilus galloprovincialis]|uniref:Hexosyltransferase n=1 Tax=Mytilus galloprovincialis TaxID=29158 RepID=A0A8B6FUN0_MYTGA|nr:Hypothetical predicted protein [Mytilus galloprovincialis]
MALQSSNCISIGNNCRYIRPYTGQNKKRSSFTEELVANMKKSDSPDNDNDDDRYIRPNTGQNKKRIRFTRELVANMKKSDSPDNDYDVNRCIRPNTIHDEDRSIFTKNVIANMKKSDSSDHDDDYDREKQYLEQNAAICMTLSLGTFSAMTLDITELDATVIKLLSILVLFEDFRLKYCHLIYTTSSSNIMQTLFYQNYGVQKGSFKAILKEKSIWKTITLHPIKDSQQQYRIQNYLLSSHIQDLHQKQLYLQREITQMEKNAGTLKPTDSITRQGMIPSLTKYKPKVRDEVLAWDYLSTSTMSHRNLNPKRAINTPLKHALEDNINQALQIMNRNARQKGRTIIIKTTVWVS